MKQTLVLLGVIGLGLLSVGNTEGQADQPWIKHAGYADFAAGRFPDGGTNLYAAGNGTIQMIHRWDFNNDGSLDIIVGQDHNNTENEDVLIYRGNRQGFKSLMPDLPTQQPLGRMLKEIHSREDGVTRLPSFGGGRSLMVDLNHDGYPDLVFCNYIHNYSTEINAIIYWGGPDGFSPDRRTLLPTMLANGVAAADFDHDGFVDLVFANHGNEAGSRFGIEKNLESYIYWNGPTGFSPERRTSIPSISAADVATGDLDNDGYPDLVIANNNAQEKSIYIYWGGPEGFSEKRRDIIRGGDPVGLQLADVDHDGKLDLIVEEADNRAVILHGTGKGFAEKPWVELPTQGATECRVADLNKDGFADLVFANPGADQTQGQKPDRNQKQVSYIYWGSAQGYSPERRTELPTLHATDAALADFNGDGWTDIAFSNEHDEKTYDVNSYVYWNGPHGFGAAYRSELQGFGPVSVQAGDFRKVGTPDLALISRNSGSYARVGGVDATLDSLIYWGNPQHYYSPASMSFLPAITSSFVIGDFNQDGWVDVAAAGYILWGGPEGYSVDRRQDLGTRELNTVATADLNHDGYLDLVGTISVPGSPAKGVILWGSKDGFRLENRTELNVDARNTGFASIADLNKDGFLDLIYPDVDGYNLNIFWGDASGTYTNARHTVMKVNPASTVQVADLNNDGWLDLILGAVYDQNNFGHPMRYMTILWGGPQGYSMDRSKRLEAYESEEQSVADLNKDGYLDIVAANYHAYTTRTLPVFVYWGGPGGSYSESRRTNLPGESTLGLFVADLNEDGWMDIVAFNHVRHGDHGVGANIFWGGPDGYSYSRRQWLPTFGPHFNVRRDIGNIYTRKLEEDYISAPLRCPKGKTPSRLSWKGDTPFGTAVKFQLRSAASKEGLEAAGWQGPAGADSYYERPGMELNPPSTGAWFQYRAVFTTPDGGSTAVLREVAIDVIQRGMR